jgi:hypothetical protein
MSPNVRGANRLRAQCLIGEALDAPARSPRGLRANKKHPAAASRLLLNGVVGFFCGASFL